MTARTVINSAGVVRRLVLKQPPHFGRIAARDVSTRNDADNAAKSAHIGAQFDRQAHTKKFGLRAKVV